MSIYGDEMFVTGSKMELIQMFKEDIEKIIEMADLGVMKYFIVMEVLHSRDYIFICLQKYILDIQNRFKMQDWKLVTTPVSTGLKLGKDDDFKKGNDNMY